MSEKALSCDICGRGPFKSASGLAGHKQLAHGDLELRLSPEVVMQDLEGLAKRVAALEGAHFLRVDEWFELYTEYVKKDFERQIDSIRQDITKLKELLKSPKELSKSP